MSLMKVKFSTEFDKDVLKFFHKDKKGRLIKYI